MIKISFFSILSLAVFSSSCSEGRQKVEKSIQSRNVTIRNPFKHQLGINGFEWDFSGTDNRFILPGRMDVINSFGGFRQYLDWDKIEPLEGKYTFNPVHSGGWRFDMIYEACKSADIEMLPCFKNISSWMLDSYPDDLKGDDNSPLPYQADKRKPDSYVQHARAAFQFAARYGYNTNIDLKLVSVDSKPRWTGDAVNELKVGMGLIKYIECNNEPDKDWRGDKARQSPEEYAANMSAFYDGDMGKLGKNAGVKSADPNMKVVMGGLSISGVDFVIKMIEWCKKNRGYKKDGKVNLCFDVINYHYYSTNHNRTVGTAPELSGAAEKAQEYIEMSTKYANATEVWLTEAGYDLNPNSPQRAIAIADKSAFITQADWMLRTALLNERCGLKRTFFYMLDDVDFNSSIQYSSSGFAVGVNRRPVADYFYQTKKLIGEFSYIKSIESEPIVDLYNSKNRNMFVLYVPEQRGKRISYKLDLGSAKSAKIYRLIPGSNEMSSTIIRATNSKILLTLTETPLFVEAI